MKYAGSIIVLFTAFALSVIAAVMSVTGMIALFAAHALVVGIMMSSLEVAKIVASGWLKYYWTDRAVPFIHKSYLVVATVILMLITSLGIYGYLSAGHLEQTAPLANVALQSGGLERQIAQKDGEVKRLEGRVALIDKNVESFLTANKAQGGLRASQTLKKERDGLQAQINTGYAEINALNDKLVPLKQQGNEVEAKLGPIKYVAALFGTTDSEAAVRFVIVMIMLVFDPLAIVLMISGLISLRRVDEAELVDDEQVGDQDGPEPEEHFVETLLANQGTVYPYVDLEDDGPEPGPEVVPEVTPAVQEDFLPEDLDEEEPIEPEEIFEHVDTDDVPAPFAVEDEDDTVANETVDVETVGEPVVDETVEEEPVVEETPVEPTFAIVQNLSDPVIDDEELDEIEEEPEAAAVEPVTGDREAFMGTEDHRERLIALLQSEPSFMNEVERIIEQIAAERVAEENERIRGGIVVPETNRTYGLDQ
jgi:hypothetical protein